MENKFNKFTFITADDHSLITHSVSFILTQLYQNSTIYQVQSIKGLLQLLNKKQTDLLILDISFQSGETLQYISKFKEIQPNLKILIYSGHDEDIYALRCINAGASGYLSKLSSLEETEKAISSVMNNGKYFSDNIQSKINDCVIFNKPINSLEKLSNRELEIAKLITEGHGNAEICSMLNLQKSTVSTYKNRIFEKLEINNLTDLMKIFHVYHFS